jgi:nucleoside-diphosphate-sugar epimerase
MIRVLILNDTILITGGRGFTAKNLAKLLKNHGLSYCFLNLDHDAEFSKYLLTSDLGLTNQLNSANDIYEFKFTGVFHLATNYQHNYDQNNFEKLVESNLILTNWLSDYCIINSIPIISAGSFTQEIFSTNNSELSVYSNVKNAGEELLKWKRVNCDLKCIFTRQYESYGHDDVRDKILYRIIDSFLTGKDLTIPQTDLELDYLNILDICNAYYVIYLNMLSNKSSLPNKIEISSRNPVKISEILNYLNERSGTKPGNVDYTQDRNSSIPSKLSYFAEWPNSWEPKFSFWSDIEDLIQNREKMQVNGIQH